MTLRQFATANQMYASDFRGFCLPAYQEFDPNASPTVGAGGRASNWWSANTAFRKYLALAQWHPAANYTADYPLITDFTPSQSAGNTSAFNAYLPVNFVCPMAGRFLTNVVTSNWKQPYYPLNVMYGMNAEGIVDTTTVNGQPNTITPWAIARPTGPGVHGWKMTQVKRGAEKLLFTDAITKAAACVVDESGSGINAATNYDKVGESTAGTVDKMTCWRHRGGANVAFFDGHVAWLRKDEIYNKDAGGNIVANDRLWKVLQ